MASEWKDCTLAELGEIVGGATPSTKDESNYGGDIVWITPKDLSTLRGRFIAHGERNITEKGLNSCSTQMMPTNAVLFSSRAPIGYVAIAKNPVCTNQGFKSIVANADNDPMFLYYLLKYNKDAIEAMGSGTTFKEVSGSTMRGIRVRVPVSKAEQQRIASVLAALDSKIENNDKINDNLYAQARALANQWVDENNSDYELLPLSDVAVINPDTYSPKADWEYVNYLDTSSITDGYITDTQRITPSAEKLPSRARRIIASNDVVFSTVRPNQRHFGIISEPLPNMLASTGFAVIRSKNPLVCNELIYLCLTENAFIEKMQQLAEQSTSTFPSIKPSDLGVCEIPCPKDESSRNLTETLKTMFALIAANHRENASLVELRDSLLQKLMSGEIDVSDIQL